MVAQERVGERVVAGNEFWTAFVPYAARWPYEIHLAPHRQVADLTELTEAERQACAGNAIPVELGRCLRERRPGRLGMLVLRHAERG